MAHNIINERCVYPCLHETKWDIHYMHSRECGQYDEKLPTIAMDLRIFKLGIPQKVVVLFTFEFRRRKVTFLTT